MTYDVSELVSQFIAKVNETEGYCLRFERLCEQYIQKLLNCSNEAAEFYLKSWFGSYLACKDEIMVLLQGTVYRKYHQVEHELYFQKRESSEKTGHQARFYKKVNFLSVCSVDGIMYEKSHNKSFSTVSY